MKNKYLVRKRFIVSVWVYDNKREEEVFTGIWRSSIGLETQTKEEFIENILRKLATQYNILSPLDITMGPISEIRL